MRRNGKKGQARGYMIEMLMYQSQKIMARDMGNDKAAQEHENKVNELFEKVIDLVDSGDGDNGL